MRKLLFLKSFLLLSWVAAAVAAQTYPNKPIRLVLPVAPGGGADVIARTVGTKVGAAIGQPFVIDNRGGAGGNIAAEIVAKSPPDGHTLGMVLSSHTINTSLYKKINYDPVKDFAPISLLATSPFLLVVHPSLPVRNVKEFIALSRKTKGGLPYASSGSGLLAHLAMELLKSQGHFEATHIPHRGTGPAMMDTVAGHVAANFPTMISGLQNVKAGRLKALAVTSRQRSTLLPNVPTVMEQGFPDYEVNGWYGWLAPTGTPQKVIALLHDEAAKAIRSTDVRERLSADGAVPVGNSPEEFARFIQSEIAKWAKVVKQSGASAE
jgi:tripartite-type tricarboxylate transporter receptor subunit TctC